MTSLSFTTMAAWPPLAWLARCDAGTGHVSVLHGPRVETAEEWFCEAAWAGDYEAGDFDTTDIVAGTGARVRNGAITFVASASTVDRLHSFDGGKGSIWISNSLPCLLAAVGAELDPTFPHYGAFFHSIVRGLAQYERSLPTSAGPVRLTYFDNLHWMDGVLTVIPKPCGDRSFATFEAYRTFLEQSMAAMIANARSPKRRHPMRPLGTLSSGYDSTAISVLGRRAGLEEVFTFAKAFSSPTLGVAAEDDSGMTTAQVLGLRCHVVEARPRQALEEVPFFAADAWGEDIQYLDAGAHLAGALLFTGYHGDKVWAKKAPDTTPNIVRGDLSGLSLTEFRLWVGFVNCPVPFWGVRAISAIQKISNAADMKRWDVPGDYSRPICRRIAEEAGVPREAFGKSKRMTATYPLMRRVFLAAESLEAYRAWLRHQRRRWLRSGRVPPLTSVGVDRLTISVAHALEKTADKLVWSFASRGRWPALPKYPRVRRLCTLTHPDHAQPAWLPRLRRYLFPWAIAASTKRYEAHRLTR